MTERSGSESGSTVEDSNSNMSVEFSDFESIVERSGSAQTVELTVFDSNSQRSRCAQTVELTVSVPVEEWAHSLPPPVCRPLAVFRSVVRFVRQDLPAGHPR